MSTRLAMTVLLLALPACAQRDARPVDLQLGEDACGYCRMVISESRFASQVIAPHESPVFFDDLGCLANYLRAHDLSPASRVFVVDHRTGQWRPAGAATFTRAVTVRAPMGSPVIAHDAPASRDLDPDAAGGTTVPVGEILPARKAAR
jgi:copper chaperone NosL